MGNTCEFCGKSLKNQKAKYSHKKSCKNWQTYEAKMQEIGKIIQETLLSGGNPDDLFQVEEDESFVRTRIYAINKDLGEIRGMVRRLLENKELKNIKK